MSQDPEKSKVGVIFSLTILPRSESLDNNTIDFLTQYRCWLIDQLGLPEPKPLGCIYTVLL